MSTNIRNLTGKNIKLEKFVEKHGTLEEFENALFRAYADLMITYQEAQTAIEKYQKDILELQQIEI
jgi:hypothetical protein